MKKIKIKKQLIEDLKDLPNGWKLDKDSIKIERAKEFIKSLGKGKSIFEIEQEENG